jgi:hypothetical protein
MDLKSTIVFEKNYDALYNHEARFIINEGGAVQVRRIHFASY